MMNITNTLFISFALLTVFFYIILKSSDLFKESVIQHSKKSPITPITNFIVLFSLVTYTLVTFLNLIGSISNIVWLLAFIMLYAILLLILAFSLKTANTLLMILATFALLLLLILSSMKISGLKPLMSDEGRYIGFSYRISKEGFWTPFKYPENAYYQAFHALPCIYSVLSITLRASPEEVPYVTLLLSISVTSIATLYLIAKIILGRSILRYKLQALIVPLIAFITPPLALVGILPRTLSYTLFLIVFYIFLSFVMKHRRTSYPELIVIVLLSITGTMLHATYPYLSLIIALTFILTAFTLFKHISSSCVALNIMKVMVIILLITCTYWAFTSALYAMVASIKNVTTGFIKFYTEVTVHGGFPAKYAIREPWYTKVPQYVLLSWSFLPALAAAYILYLLPQVRKWYHMSKPNSTMLKLSFIMSAVGLAIISLSYIQRLTSGLALYLGYKAYTLILPSVLAYHFIVCKSKSVLRYVLASMLVLYAVLGIISPDIRVDMLNVRPAATHDGWVIARSIYSLISDEYTKNIDRELRIGLNAMLLKYNPSLFEFYRYRIQSSITLSIIKQHCLSEHLYKNSNLVFHSHKYVGVLQSVKRL